MKKAYWLIIAILLHGTQLLFAQTSKGTVTGKLFDVADSSIISLATVTVYRISDSSIQTYRLSNTEGLFNIPGLPLHTNLRLVVTHTAHKTFRHEFAFTDSSRLLDLGQVFLIKSTQQLEEVIVMAERPPVIVRNDTIEFNASAFRTLPNALVEDLLKKLPGVSVARNGQITYNGKVVNKIKVDGRPFFGDDVTMATRNLPANVIDKVQVMDDEEQLQLNPLTDRSRVEKVINLTFKKGVKKGGFGKVYAGAGTKERYEAGGILNIFRDTLQVSLLGYVNNLNKPAFGMSDVKDIGGFNRSGVSTSMFTQSGGFELNGISFGGTEEGIQQSEGGGINLNTEFGSKVTFNARYFYGKINSQLDKQTEMTQYLGDSSLTTVSNSARRSHKTVHRIGGQLTYRINQSSTLTLKPSIGVDNNNLTTQTNQTTFLNFTNRLNTGDALTQFRNQSILLQNDLRFTRTFKKRGRYLSLSGTGYTRNTTQRQNAATSNTYFGDSTFQQAQSQRRNKSNPYSSLSLTANYTEPVFSRSSLTFGHTLTIRSDKDGLSTWLKDSLSQKFNIAPGQTNDFKRTTVSNTSNLALNTTIGSLRLTPGISIQSLQNKITSNHYRKQQQFTYLWPTFDLSWDNLFFSYSLSVTEPGSAQMQPAPDSTNPLYIYNGNPQLIPTTNNYFSLSYNKYPTDNKIGYYLSLFANKIKNGLVSERTIDDKGVQNHRWVNENELWYFRATASATKNVAISTNWTASFEFQLQADSRNTVVIVNNKRSRSHNINLSPRILYSMNMGDHVSLTQEYSIEWLKGTFKDQFYPTIRNTNHYLNTDISIRLSKSIVAESSLTTYNNPGTLVSAATLWNAAVHWLLFKDQSGSLKLTCYDLLNGNRTITRTVQENYRSESVINALTKFYLVSFAYNIRNIRERGGAPNNKLLLF